MSNVNTVRESLALACANANDAIAAAQHAITNAENALASNTNKKKAKALAANVQQCRDALAECEGVHAVAVAELQAHDEQAKRAAAPRADYVIPLMPRPAANVQAPAVSDVQRVSISIPHNGAYDSLNGRLGARTHIMHTILAEAYARGERLSASTITARVNVVWARALAGASTTEAATQSHLSTMKRRGYVTSGAGYSLTKRAYLALTRGVAPESIAESECV